MANPPRIVRCCIRDEDGDLCTLTAHPMAPFPVCGTHLAKLATFLRETPLVDLMKGGIRGPGPAAPRSWVDRLVKSEPYKDVVYYIRVDSLIKVGTTCRIRQRLAGYPPHAILLATEPGGQELEGQRHQQFRSDLASGREWFRPSVALIEHINSLREQPLTAADLAA